MSNFFGCYITVLVLGLFLTAAVNGASFPDTSICTGGVTIDFPAETTISKDYLLIANCLGPADLNSGDFVTIWIEDTSGSPILSVSKYAETNAGVEWISPLSDSNGQAWDRLELDPQFFDCNSTGIPYTIKVQWDNNAASQNFDVLCPTIELIKYRQQLPYWEKLRVEAEVTDNLGLRMKGIECTSKVLDIGTDENASVITIRQEHETQFTGSNGRARFEYSSGLLQDLLQGFTYTVEVNCLGGDANFSFVVEEQESVYLRNPLYYFYSYMSDNIVPIIAAFVLGIITVGVLYAIFLRRQ